MRQLRRGCSRPGRSAYGRSATSRGGRPGRSRRARRRRPGPPPRCGRRRAGGPRKPGRRAAAASPCRRPAPRRTRAATRRGSSRRRGRRGGSRSRAPASAARRRSGSVGPPRVRSNRPSHAVGRQRLDRLRERHRARRAAAPGAPRGRRRRAPRCRRPAAPATRTSAPAALGLALQHAAEPLGVERQVGHDVGAASSPAAATAPRQSSPVRPSTVRTSRWPASARWARWWSVSASIRHVAHLARREQTVGRVGVAGFASASPMPNTCSNAPDRDNQTRTRDRSGRPAHHPGRPGAQPQGRLARPAARRPDRVHRPVRLRQVQPGLRHDLRRGPAPLRRVALGVRPAVPRPDGQARRRLHRGPLARGLDRPEVHVARTRARRSAPSPRSTTTSGCCSPASAGRTARRAARRSSGRRRSRSSTGCSRSRRVAGSRCSRR